MLLSIIIFKSHFTYKIHLFAGCVLRILGICLQFACHVSIACYKGTEEENKKASPYTTGTDKWSHNSTKIPTGTDKLKFICQKFLISSREKGVSLWRRRRQKIYVCTDTAGLLDVSRPEDANSNTTWIVSEGKNLFGPRLQDRAREAPSNHILLLYSEPGPGQVALRKQYYCFFRILSIIIQISF